MSKNHRLFFAQDGDTGHFLPVMLEVEERDDTLYVKDTELFFMTNRGIRCDEMDQFLVGVSCGAYWQIYQEAKKAQEEAAEEET